MGQRDPRQLDIFGGVPHPHQAQLEHVRRYLDSLAAGWAQRDTAAASRIASLLRNACSGAPAIQAARHVDGRR